MATLVAIDVGTQTTAIAAAPMGSKATPSAVSIVRDTVNEPETPTLIGFKGTRRFLAPAAAAQIGTNGANTVTDLPLLMGGAASVPEEVRDTWRFRVADVAAGTVTVAYPEEETLRPEQLAASLLVQWRNDAATSIGQEAPTADDRLALVLPADTSAERLAAWRDAARIAGFGDVQFVSGGAATAAVYLTKFPPAADAETRHVIVLDVGFSRATASLLSIAPAGGSSVLAEKSVTAGTRVFVGRLFDHLMSSVKGTAGRSSRPAYRLRQQCEKTVKVLSSIADHEFEVENIIEDQATVFKITRDQLESLVADVCSSIEALCRDVAGETKIDAVELLGGGSRIPCVRAAVTRVFGDDVTLGRTLDEGASRALGCALVALAEVQKEGDADAPTIKAPAHADAAAGMSDEAVAAAVAFEEACQARDADIVKLEGAKNELESYVFHMKAEASNGKNAQFFTAPTVGELLTTADNWLMDEGDDASLEDVQGKLADLKAAVEAAAPEYFAHVAAEKARVEENLRKEHERALAAGELDKEDHDQRKMKKEDRMRLVVKNKEEGNELFRGGNYQHAVNHYVKALTHTDKFFDLDDAGKKEVDALRLSLYLNTAQCLIKAEVWSRAAENSRLALQIDPASTKALYRFALAKYHMKEYDEAEKHVKQALELSPEDKGVANLAAHVAKAQAKIREKERNMAKKMFGGE